MDITAIMEQARTLAKMHVKLDHETTNIWISLHPDEIRLVEVSKTVMDIMGSHDNYLYAYQYNPVPKIGITVHSQLVLLSPNDWKKVEEGKYSLPENWNKKTLMSLYDGEDARKTGLKKGLRQLNITQLKRVIEFPGQMILDEVNYADGKFCPLAVALNLDKIITEPSHEKVFEVLTTLGYNVYNTRGIEGNFYTTHRKEDLLEAAQEVLQEKLEIDANY